MESLKKLYDPILLSEKIEHDGIPRTIVCCYNANATPKLAVATSNTTKDGKGKCGEYILWWNTIASITQRSIPSASAFSTWTLGNA